MRPSVSSTTEATPSTSSSPLGPTGPRTGSSPSVTGGSAADIPRTAFARSRGTPFPRADSPCSTAFNRLRAPLGRSPPPSLNTRAAYAGVITRADDCGRTDSERSHAWPVHDYGCPPNCPPTRTHPPRSRPMALRARQRCHAVLTGLVALASAAVLSTATPAQAADTWTEVGLRPCRSADREPGPGLGRGPRQQPQPLHGHRHHPRPRSAAAAGTTWVTRTPPTTATTSSRTSADSGNAKMFRVQAPDGTWSEYVHTLGSGEALNNSFAAVTPGGQWMVSGEWGTMTRLLVHPTPGVNAGTSPSANLPWTSSIRLDHAVRDIQGCDFLSATTLLCSSDDPAGTLFGMTKPLLQDRPLRGAGHLRRHRPCHGPAPAPAAQLLLGRFRDGGHRLRPPYRHPARDRHLAGLLCADGQQDLPVHAELMRRG